MCPEWPITWFNKMAGTWLLTIWKGINERFVCIAAANGPGKLQNFNTRTYMICKSYLLDQVTYKYAVYSYNIGPFYTYWINVNNSVNA